MHPAAVSVDELLKHCRETRTRRSGPGGQHRNKTETAVVLEHEPTGVTAEANERRSQAENRQVAAFRLRVTLAISVRLPSDGRSVPSVLWLSRCRAGRISVNVEHADFPALLAEALDVIAVSDFDLRPAAEVLHVTASQLVKFLKLEPRALLLVNQARQTRQWHGFA